MLDAEGGVPPQSARKGVLFPFRPVEEGGREGVGTVQQVRRDIVVGENDESPPAEAGEERFPEADARRSVATREVR